MTDTVGVSFGERAFERQPEPEKPAEGTTEGSTEGTEGDGAQPAAETHPPVEGEPAKPEEKPQPEIQVEKRPPIDQIVEGAVKKALESHKPEPAAKPQPETPKQPEADPYEQNLGEIEREELEFYRYAAKKDEKYKDLPAKLIGYYKKVDAWVELERAKDPDRTFDQNDAEFRQFIARNKPMLQAPERRKLERLQIEESVAERIKRENDERFNKLQQETHLLKVQPQIKRVVDQFSEGLQTVLEQEPPENQAREEASIVADVVKRARQEGWAKVKEEDPFIAPVVHDLQQRGVQIAAEYTSLMAKAKEFDGQNPDHQWLLAFIRNQGQHFAQNGGEARIRDGKQFLPVSEYNERLGKDPNSAGNYWTFNERDVLERLAMNTRFNIEAKVKAQNEQLKKSIYQRQAAAKNKNQIPKPETPAAAQPAPAASNPAKTSPKATPVSSPGAGKSNPVSTPKIMDDATMRALGLPVMT